MRRLAPFAALVLSGCAALGVHDGVYTAPGGEFSVMQPPLPEVSYRSGSAYQEAFVDFSSGEGDWTRAGGYSLDWFGRERAYSSDADFQTEMQRVLPKMAVNYTEGLFHTVQQGPLQLGGHRAYRLVAEGVRGSTPAWWVATAFEVGDGVAVSMLLVPKQNADHDGPASAEAVPDWGFYPAFTASIKPP
jgi:hypothetical protein